MKVIIEQQGKLTFEKLYREKELSAEDKLFILYLQQMTRVRQGSEIDLNEIYHEGNIFESLMKMQLKGYIQASDGKLTLTFSQEGMKNCIGCLEDKEMDEYSNNKSQNDGKDNYCKECRLKINQEYRQSEGYEQSRLKSQEKLNIKRREERDTGKLKRLEDSMKEALENDLRIDHDLMVARGFSQNFIFNNEEAHELIEVYRELSRKKYADKVAEEYALKKKGNTYQVDKFGSVQILQEEEKKEEKVTEKAFDDMKTKEKVVHLYNMGGFSQKDIAEYIGISQATVSIHIKAMKKAGKI